MLKLPVFRYEAVNQAGQKQTGELEAASRVDVVRMAKSLGHLVTDVHDVHGVQKEGTQGSRKTLRQTSHNDASNEEQLSRKGIGSKLRCYFWSQLAMALRSGLEIIPALNVVVKQTKNAHFKAVISQLVEQVETGESLSSALKRHPRSFPDLDVAMVRVGETGGVLTQTTAALSKFSKRDQEVRNKLQSASAYPIFVLILGLASLVVILTWILPKIMSALLENGNSATLPWPTRVLLTLSETARSPLGVGIVLLIAGLMISLIHWTKSGEGRYWKDFVILKIPLLGASFAKVAVARFARTLGTLLSAGVPVMEAFHVVRDTLGNEYLAREIDRLSEAVREGESIAGPLSESELFPPLLAQVIAMGERTGTLDELLLETAESYEMESEAVLQMVLTILPVVMIVLLAIMIVFVLAGVLLPMVEMSQLSA